MLGATKYNTIIFLIFFALVGIVLARNNQVAKQLVRTGLEGVSEDVNLGGPGLVEAHPMSIAALRTGEHPGSDIVIEQELESGSSYTRAIASHKSEGLKIFGLLTVPTGAPPESGWPIIVFNHGYIAPSQYATTERYVAYQDAFARAGYITFKSDYRGHANSQGQPSGAYGSPGYTIDVMNAVASLKQYPSADPNRIGMWGHSMGGFITLRTMVARGDIKAGVVWAGVVASYPDLLTRWYRRSANREGRRADRYEDINENPDFWNSVSANTYLADISGPIQIHHGTSDTSVPVEFSQELHEDLQALGETSEVYIYDGDDHNISANLSIALQRSVEFFDKHVKGE